MKDRMPKKRPLIGALRLGPRLRKWGNRDLWKSFLICMLWAFIAFLVHAAWGKSLVDKAGNQTELGALIVHIQHAFIVAGILTLTIEYNARRRTEKETRGFGKRIAHNVFQGLLEHVVPGPVLDEIKSFLRASVIRRECKYVLTFDRPYSEMPADFFVIRRELSFEVENLTTHDTIFPVRSSYSAHPDRVSSGWNRQFHLALEINAKPVPELDKYLTVEGNSHFLEYPLRLGPHQRATVYLSGEEPSRIGAGSNSYTQGTTVIGIEVDIRNVYPEAIDQISVFMHHPSHNDTLYKNGRYFLDRAFLPGQGFEIRWRTGQAAEIAAPS